GFRYTPPVKPICRAMAPLFVRSSSFLFAFVLALVPLRATSADVIDRILVRVNSRIVTQSSLDSRVEQATRENPDAARGDEIRKSVMEELVNESLLEDRARDLDVITTDSDIEEQIKHLKDQNQVTSDEDFAKALAASGLTVDRLREQLKRTLTVQRVVGREVNSKVDLSDEALRIIYEREKDSWKIPEQAHLAEVLIAAGDDPGQREGAAKRAREASDKVKAGTKFDEVVKEYSNGSTKSRGGDLGVVSKGDLNPEIDRAVFSLPTGAVSDPIATKFGWHIVKVIEKFPVSYRPFNEVKPELLKREQETQFQKKLAEYLEKLKRDAVIRVAPEASAYYTAPSTVNAPAVIPVVDPKKKSKKSS
ncbi:MAG: peptidylprolyl isomerase, partial [Thermoanaerobaculia bacterium]